MHTMVANSTQMNILILNPDDLSYITMTQITTTASFSTATDFENSKCMHF